jgi:hypothetical protein
MLKESLSLKFIFFADSEVCETPGNDFNNFNYLREFNTYFQGESGAYFCWINEKIRGKILC